VKLKEMKFEFSKVFVNVASDIENRRFRATRSLPLCVNRDTSFMFPSVA